MRCKYGLVLISLVAIVLTSSAFLESDITITNSSEWAIAGGGPVSIYLKVENSSLSGFQLADTRITASIMEMGYGTITPISELLGADGVISFKFTPEKLKGTANINFLVYYNDTFQNVTSYKQKIDHAEPKEWSLLNHDSPITVNNITPIKIRFTDIYGNIVDNIRDSDKHEIKFSDSEDGDGGFCTYGLDSCDNSELIIDCQSNNDNYISGFIGGNGNATVCYKVSKIAGDNYIRIVAPVTVVYNEQYIDIIGLPDIPDKIQSSVISLLPQIGIHHHQAVANGVDTFGIYYLVTDKYNNPKPNVKVQLTITGPFNSEVRTFSTNYQGIVYLSFGPSTIISTTTVVAEIPEFKIIDKITDILSFVSGGPYQFALAANPNIISSRDVPEHSNNYTIVSARIMDSLGRGIGGKTINFNLTDTTSADLKAKSSFDISTENLTASAISDSIGFVSLKIYPGIFNKSAPGYAMNLSGTTLVSAEVAGSGVTGAITFTYKNYPYIRAEVSLDKNNISLQQFFNASLCLIGDGYTPPRKPIDVIFANSRAPSMMRDYPDRIISTRKAARIITENLSLVVNPELYDRAGVWTFSDKGFSNLTYEKDLNWKNLVGSDQDQCDTTLPPEACTAKNKENHTWMVENYYSGSPRDYSDYATCETGVIPINSSLVANKTEVETAIDKIVPYLSVDNIEQGGSLRYGLYKSITDLRENGRSDAVKAVIALIDQNYNWFGDPRAASGTSKEWDGDGKTSASVWIKFPLEGPPYIGGWGDPNLATTWQNMSNYARDKHIRIYVVAYSTQFNQDVIKEYNILCNSTGGFFREAPTEEDLYRVYKEIGESLKVLASVNTSVNLNFVDLKTVDGFQTVSGNKFLNYTFILDHSTFIDSSLNGIRIDEKLRIPPYPGPYPAPVYVTLNDGRIYTKYPYTVDQTMQWRNTNSLSLYIGNVSIGQKWCADFTFQGNQTGCVDLFNKSVINYSSDEISPTFASISPGVICVQEDIPGEFKFQNQLNIINASLTPEKSTELLNISWLLNYTGSRYLDVKQIIYYQYSPDNVTWSGDWIQFDSNLTGGRELILLPCEAKLDVRDRTGFIKIKIFSFELPLGGVSDQVEIGPIDIGALRQNTIIIE